MVTERQRNSGHTISEDDPETASDNYHNIDDDDDDDDNNDTDTNRSKNSIAHTVSSEFSSEASTVTELQSIK